MFKWWLFSNYISTYLHVFIVKDIYIYIVMQRFYVKVCLKFIVYELAWLRAQIFLYHFTRLYKKQNFVYEITLIWFLIFELSNYSLFIKNDSRKFGFQNIIPSNNDYCYYSCLCKFSDIISIVIHRIDCLYNTILKKYTGCPRKIVWFRFLRAGKQRVILLNFVFLYSLTLHIQAIHILQTFLISYKNH